MLSSKLFLNENSLQFNIGSNVDKSMRAVTLQKPLTVREGGKTKKRMIIIISISIAVQ